MPTKRRKRAQKKRTQPRKRKVKIFISHSRRDVSLVRLIVDFLMTSNIHKEEIRCTSVPGFGIRLGRKVNEAIRDDIKECSVILGVLTKDSLDSLTVVLELGAGWGFDKTLVPITGPGISLSDLPDWLKGPHGMAWDHKECWEDFEHDVFAPLKKKIKDEDRFDELIYELIHWKPREPRRRRVKPKRRTLR
jgi:hypothetical protein